MRGRRRLTAVAVTGLASLATFASVGTAAGGVPAGTSNGGGEFLPAPGHGSGAHPGRTPALARTGTIVAYSTNWAGYSSRPPPKAPSRRSRTRWTVPTVTPTRKAEYSSDWVGIGGYSDATLVQAGTEQDSIHHKAFYQAWTEVLPAPEDAAQPDGHARRPHHRAGAGDRRQHVADEGDRRTSGSERPGHRERNVSSGASVEAIHERPCLANPCANTLPP